MNSEERLDELLNEYEERLESGEETDVARLCRDCPELLPELRRRIEKLRSFDRLVGISVAGAEDGPEGARFTAGRYRATEFLARGGLGEVYRAVDDELGREVALKRLKPGLARDRTSRSRFAAEAKTAGLLEHPGIVPVYGLGYADDGSLSYAMRLIRGETLDAAIARLHGSGEPDGEGDRLLESDLLRRFLSLCQAVAYAHARGVIHRDIKPANVLLGAYGETILVDWGLARAIEDGPDAGTSDPDSEESPDAAGGGEKTLPGEVKGSPAYMSPEQALGRQEEVGPASDVFGLGATLYKILTGRAPYSGGDALEKAREGVVPSPRSVMPGVPGALDAVCKKAMSRDPAARYATVMDLAADVERYLADEPVSAWREPAGLRCRRFMRRHRTLVVAGAAALTVAVAALALISVKQRKANADLRVANRRIKASAEEARKGRAAAETQRDRAEYGMYRMAIRTAETEIERGSPAGADAALAQCVPAKGRPDRRGFEWYLLRRRAHPEVFRTSVHGVQALRFASNDRLMIGPGRFVRIREGSSGVSSTASAPRTGPRAAAVSADGSRYVTTKTTEGKIGLGGAQERSSEISMSDLHAGGKTRVVARIRGAVEGVGLSPDGSKVAAVAEDGRLYVWDVAAGRATFSGCLPGMQGEGGFGRTDMAFTPDGKALGILVERHPPHTLGERFLVVFDLASGRFRFDPVPVDFRESVFPLLGGRPLVAGPDGREFAVGATDGSIRFYGAADGRLTRTLTGTRETAVCLAFSRDGRLLVAGGLDRVVRCYDLQRRTSWVVGAFDSHIDRVAVRSDGLQIAGSSADEIKVFDTRRAREETIPDNAGPVTAVAVTRSGMLVTGGADGKLRLYDAGTRKLLARSDEGDRVVAVKFVSDRLLAVATAHRVDLIGPGKGEVKTLFRLGASAMRIDSVSASPDGRWLAVGADLTAGSGTLAVFDVVKRRLEWKKDVGGMPTPVFSPDGRSIYCFFDDFAFTSHEITFRSDAGQKVGSRDGWFRVAFSPDGKLAAWVPEAREPEDDRRIEIRDVASNRLVARVVPPPGVMLAVRFGPSSRRLVVFAEDADSHAPDPISIYDAATGDLLLQLPDGPSEVTAIGGVPDARAIVTGHKSGMVRVFEAAAAAAKK